MSARLVQDVSKISKENMTNVADWIKKAEVKDVSLVLIRGNWENVVPRRGLWEVGEAITTLVLISLNLRCLEDD